MAIDLIIQSQNYKDISILDLNTFSQINTTVNNVSVNLPSGNYLLDISSSTSSYSWLSFWNNLSKFEQDGTLIFFIVLFIIILIASLKIIKRM